MKNLYGLIPKYLLKNKKRNFSIAVTIMLSITLITSLSIMISTLEKNMLEQVINEDGCMYDISILCKNSNKKTLDKINKNSIIDKKTTFVYMGKSNIENSQYSIEINGYDQNVCDIFNFKLVNGQYPKKGNEIALENWIIDNMNPKPKIGDKITLTSLLNQGVIEKKITNEFILVGTFNHIFEHNLEKSKAKAYVCKEFVEKTIPNNFKSYQEYITLKKDIPIKKGFNLISILGGNGMSIKFNQNKLFLLDSIKLLKGITSILYFIICIVSIVLIYNIFNTSIIERTKEFGMLSAIGLCPSQVMKLVIGEGLLIGCIFIPLSLILGNFVCKGFMSLISNTNYFNKVIDIPTSAIVISLIVGFSSILLGTYSSSKQASKISPMEAINSTSNLEIEKRTLKSKKFSSKTKNSFIKDMAGINIKRNRKKFVTTVISLSISIILFMLVYYIINCTDPNKNVANTANPDFTITCDNKKNSFIHEKYIKAIENTDGIKNVEKYKKYTSALLLPKEKVTKEGVEYIINRSKFHEETKNYLLKNIYEFTTNIYGYDDKSLKNLSKYVDKGNINLKEMQTNLTAVVVQNLNYNNVTNLKVGDKIRVLVPMFDDEGNYTYESDQLFTIGAVLKDNPLITQDGTLTSTVIISNKLPEKHTGIKGSQKLKIYLDKHSNYNKVEKKLKKIVESSRTLSMKSSKEEMKKSNQNILKVSLILYSFAAIAAIVSIINIFNVMKMNILLRKKEFGMLRAIGMGKDEITKMIMTEGLFYAIFSIIWGVLLGTLFTYLFFISTRKSFAAGMVWHFPTILVVYIIFIVLGICLLAAFSSSKRVFCDSIVDSIRTIE